jgi:hypothetical protein
MCREGGGPSKAAVSPCVFLLDEIALKKIFIFL